MLGFAIYIYEMTMHLKGHYADKISITYRGEGYISHTDGICQKGYTYQIFMCTDTVPKTCLDKILSPLHARVMTLFDTAERKHHQCDMDNIYNSA